MEEWLRRLRPECPCENYLSMDEMQELNEIVTMYLDYATRQATDGMGIDRCLWPLC